jgi:outer membrane protein assembly factor BamE
MRIISSFVALSLAFSTSACIYKLDVQQGNVVTQDAVSKLKKGMTKTEVRQVLGTPLLMDPFHGNRWDYFFSTEARGKVLERNKFSVFFENDRLVSLSGDVKPAAPAAPEAPAATNAPSAAAPSTPAPATPAAAAPAKQPPATNAATK